MNMQFFSVVDNDERFTDFYFSVSVDGLVIEL